VNIRVADPDHPRLASHPVVTDVDVVVACGQTDAGAGAQSDVAIAGGISKKGKRSIGGIAGAGAIA
jgi:hypothetical protein